MTLIFSLSLSLSLSLSACMSLVSVCLSPLCLSRLFITTTDIMVRLAVSDDIPGSSMFFLFILYSTMKLIMPCIYAREIMTCPPDRQYYHWSTSAGAQLILAAM